MIDDDIRALRDVLVDGPTPGPWENFPVGHGSQCVARVNNREVVPPDACELAHEIVDARYIAAASPDRIARLLDEVERLRAENASLRAAILNSLPGVRYMDPPDGGGPSIAEQLLRMAEDAERYLWLRENTYGVAPEPTPTVPHLVHIDSSSDWRLALDDAIDAARKEEGK